MRSQNPQKNFCAQVALPPLYMLITTDLKNQIHRIYALFMRFHIHIHKKMNS